MSKFCSYKWPPPPPVCILKPYHTVNTPVEHEKSAPDMQKSTFLLSTPFLDPMNALEAPFPLPKYCQSINIASYPPSERIWTMLANLRHLKLENFHFFTHFILKTTPRDHFVLHNFPYQLELIITTSPHIELFLQISYIMFYHLIFFAAFFFGFHSTTKTSHKNVSHIAINHSTPQHTPIPTSQHSIPSPLWQM